MRRGNKGCAVGLWLVGAVPSNAVTGWLGVWLGGGTAGERLAIQSASPNLYLAWCQPHFSAPFLFQVKKFLDPVTAVKIEVTPLVSS